MDITDTVLTIAGVTATVVLGIYAIILAVRYSRQTGISYLEDTCLALFDDITQGITDLDIRFKNSPISKKIVIVQGYFFNTGRLDISTDMVEKPLRLVVPEGYNWIDCQITNASKDLEVHIAKFSNNIVEFNIGMLKIREFFKFSALVTVPSGDVKSEKVKIISPNIKFRQALSFDHRIKDMRNIKMIRLVELQSGSFSPIKSGSYSDPIFLRIVRNLYRNNSIVYGIIFILASIGLYFLLIKSISKSLEYEITGPEELPILVHTLVEDNQIVLLNEGGYRKKISLKNFDDLQKRTVLKSPDLVYGTIFLAIYAGVGIISLLACSIRYILSRKYRFILHVVQS